MERKANDLYVYLLFCRKKYIIHSSLDLYQLYFSDILLLFYYDSVANGIGTLVG